MKSFKNIPFTHEGKEYEIRIFHDDSKVTVIAFSNHYPANGYRYQVQFSKNIKIEQYLEAHNLENLIDFAKKDILNNSWDKFSKV